MGRVGDENASRAPATSLQPGRSSVCRSVADLEIPNRWKSALPTKPEGFATRHGFYRRATSAKNYWGKLVKTSGHHD